MQILFRTLAMSLATVLLLASPAVALQETIEGYPDPYGESGYGGKEPGAEMSGSYLGIDTEDITSERMSALKLTEERGVEIMMVDQDAPAGKAGLKEHDVILEFNGARVEGQEQLRRLIHEIPPGRTVNLGISRNGQRLAISVQLADRAKAAATSKMLQYHSKSMTVPAMPAFPDMDMPAFDFTMVSSGGAGVLVENLTPQLGEFFGVKGGQGVLVRSVEKGSAAEAAGLKAGDVIVRAAGERINSRGDWKLALRTHRSGKVALGIVRDKREQNLSLTLPENKAKDSSSVLDVPDVDVDWDDVEISLNAAQVEKLRHTAQAAARQVQANEACIHKAILQAQNDVQGKVKVQLEQLEKELAPLERELEQAVHGR